MVGCHDQCVDMKDQSQLLLMPARSLCFRLMLAVPVAVAVALVQEAVAHYLGFMRVRITEELAFLNGSTLYGAMLQGGGGSRAAGDTFFLRPTSCPAFFMLPSRRRRRASSNHMLRLRAPTVW